MIKALRLQVQPHLAKGLDIHAVQAACVLIADMPLVVRHHFDDGHDGVHYFNFTFGTMDLSGLWREIQSRLYSDRRARRVDGCGLDGHV